MSIELLLGGQKSGKSRHALDRLAGTDYAFVATGVAADGTFAAQIAAHRTEREALAREAGHAPPPVYECRDALADTLERAWAAHPYVLVDALDFWVFACMEAGTLEQEKARLDAVLAELLDAPAGALAPNGPGGVVFVSCEVGLAPIDANAQVRAFVRELGAVNQLVAARAERVTLVVAGCALHIKQPPG